LKITPKEQAMANPKSNTKMTGALHLPDVESELPIQEGASGRTVEKGGPVRGVSKAGVLRDPDEAPSDGDDPRPDEGAASGGARPR
jgi:hypothetical protein